MCPDDIPRFSEEDEAMLDAIRNKHIRILIVDDNWNYRKSMSFNLRVKYGADVCSIGSSEEAIENLSSGKAYELIFLDIIMPGMNGVELYKELKRINPASMIVMMSAHVGSSEWEEVGRLDIERLVKPISEDTMASLLSSALKLALC